MTFTSIKPAFGMEVLCVRLLTPLNLSCGLGTRCVPVASATWHMAHGSLRQEDYKLQLRETVSETLERLGM